MELPSDILLYESIAALHDLSNPNGGVPNAAGDAVSERDWAGLRVLGTRYSCWLHRMTLVS